jgi:hypothetical protein
MWRGRGGVSSGNRFCDYGHDTLAPHGLWVSKYNTGREKKRCAECGRIERRKRYAEKCGIFTVQTVRKPVTRKRDDSNLPNRAKKWYNEEGGPRGIQVVQEPLGSKSSNAFWMETDPLELQKNSM